MTDKNGLSKKKGWTYFFIIFAVILVIMIAQVDNSEEEYVQTSIGGVGFLDEEFVETDCALFADGDVDGLIDQYEELYFETDSRKQDTDGDGVYDGDELEQGLNPTGEGVHSKEQAMNYLEHQDRKTSCENK